MRELMLKRLKAHKKYLLPEIKNSINRKHFEVTMEQIIKAVENNTELPIPLNTTWYEKLVGNPIKYQQYAYEIFDEISDNTLDRFVDGYSKVYTGLIYNEKN